MQTTPILFDAAAKPEIREDILRGMARYVWADAWASLLENEGNGDKLGCGKNLCDIAPETPEFCAVWAQTLYVTLEVLNGIEDLALWFHKKYPGANAYDFGGRVGMEAVGSGISWSDDYPDFALTFPFSCELYAYYVPAKKKGGRRGIEVDGYVSRRGDPQ